MKFVFSDFYVDRFWIKTYPECYLARDYEAVRELRSRGPELTENAFSLYRTLYALRVAWRKGELDAVLNGEKSLAAYREYGEASYRDVWREPPDKLGLVSDYGLGELVVGLEAVCYTRVGRGWIPITRDMVETVRLVNYSSERGVEKWIYFSVNNSFLRVMVKPYCEPFKPPIVRLILNAVNYAKSVMKREGALNIELYEKAKYAHENWFFSECGDVKRFKELNERFFRYNWEKVARALWRLVFDYQGAIVVRLSQVEYACDFIGDKWKLIDALRTLKGEAVTLKVGGQGFYWTESDVIKFYANVTKTVQAKVYSKVGLPDGRTLHRLEFTLNLRSVKYQYAEGLERWGEVLRALNQRLAVLNESAFEGLKRLIDPLIPTDVEYKDEHREFLFAILLLGSLKGSERWRKVAEVYKRRGLVKSVGRGRYSYYTLTDVGLVQSEALRSFLEKVGISVKELAKELKPLKPASATDFG